MKGKLRKLCSVILTMVLCLSVGVPTQAASDKNSAATAKYKRYLKSNHGSYEIVDLDKNGVVELVFHNRTTYVNEVFSYNPKTKKKIVLERFGMGKGYGMEVKVNKTNGYVRLPSASTGGSTYNFYKMKKGKLTKFATLDCINGKFEKAGYKIDGKYVSAAKYKKELKRLSKGMRKLSKVSW